MPVCSEVVRYSLRRPCLPIRQHHVIRHLYPRLGGGGRTFARCFTTAVNLHNGHADPKPKRVGKRTTVKLGDLAQGLVRPKDAADEPEEVVVPATGYPTVIQQARDNMAKLPNCVVLTRVGGFYELYFHQAEKWASQLNLKLAKKKTSRGPVSMAGFPVFQRERYLKALVQDHGVHVAIAEETANDSSQRVKSGGLMFNREIRRIVTPGTLIDEEFLAPDRHNYLLGVADVESSDSDATKDVSQSMETSEPRAIRQLSCAWIDLSSGDFWTQVAPATELGSMIARITPGEIVIDQGLRDNGVVSDALIDHEERVSYHEKIPNTSNESTPPILLGDPQHDTSSSYVCASRSSDAARLLLRYVEQQLPGTTVRLQQPCLYEPTQHMRIDKNTSRGLEILRTLKDGTEKGTLLNTIQRTSTKSGTRLLSQRLVSPSTSIPEVKRRLDLVQDFMWNFRLVEEAAELLGRSADAPRLVQAIAMGKGDAQDLLSLAKTISLTKHVAELLETQSDSGSSINALVQHFRWDGPLQLAKRVQDAIDEEGLMARYEVRENEAADAATLAQEAIAAEGAEDMAALHRRLGSARRRQSAATSDEEGDEDLPPDDEIWIMRRSAGKVLNMLHQQLSILREESKALADGLQWKLGAKSLTLKVSPGLGHIVHVKGKDVNADFSTVAEGARTVSSSKSTRSLVLPAWTSLGRRIDHAKLRIRGEEQQIFKSLREDVCQNIVALRRNASVLDEIDVGCSSAILAKECNLVRPVLDESTSMHIFDGRHMTVEAGLRNAGRSFTPNDTIIGHANAHVDNDLTRATTKQSSIHLITGPNMAGKSTYLRETALISIMAQTGLYVPASFARLGLVDAVFSRIGSADNLYQDQSTFMVEMLETAEILRHAGPRSLVVMDEVGRGTSPEDGIAVGYAVLETLRRKGVGRVMFATHFHKVIGMCKDWKEVACYCTRVVEDGIIGSADASFRFDHKMRPGVNRDSHALKVAKLAGLPNSTIQVAKQVLRTSKEP